MPHYPDDPRFPREPGETDEEYENRLNQDELNDLPLRKIKYKGRNAFLREFQSHFDVVYDRTFHDDPVAELPKKWNPKSFRYEPILEKEPKPAVKEDSERKKAFKEKLKGKLASKAEETAPAPEPAPEESERKKAFKEKIKAAIAAREEAERQRQEDIEVMTEKAQKRRVRGFLKGAVKSRREREMAALKPVIAAIPEPVSESESDIEMPMTEPSISRVPMPMRQFMATHAQSEMLGGIRLGVGQDYRSAFMKMMGELPIVSHRGRGFI